MVQQQAGLLRCPEILARSGQQLVLADALDRLAGGAGTGVVIEGEAGVGKSRLVEWLVEEAGRRSIRTVVGRASDAGKPTALAPIQESLLGLPELITADRVDELGALAPLLAHLLPIPGATRSDEVTPTLLGHAVLQGVTAISPGVVVIIEDLHAADADTISVVRHLLSHAARSPIAVVATARREGPGRDLIAAARSAGATVLSLPRLSAAEAADVASAVLGTSQLPTELVDHIELAEGLPLLLEDLLADLIARGDLQPDDEGWRFTGTTGVSSDRFENVVQRRIRQLEPDAAALVGAAAVLGPVMALDVLPVASGVPLDRIGAAIRQAAGAQLLRDDGSGFRHSLTREVALSTVPLFERSAIARRLAPLLTDPPDTMLAECGELLVLANEHDAAARLLVRSAKAERLSGAIDTALQRLERACEVVSDPELGTEIILLTVQTRLAMGRLASARDLAATKEGDLPVDARIDLWLALAAGDAATADGEGFDSHLLSATELMAENDPRRPRAMALTALRMLQFSDEGDRVDRAEQLATSAAEQAETVGDAAAECDAWMIVGRCTRFRDLDLAAEAYERARRVAKANDLAPRYLQALHELGTMDMLRRCDGARLELAREQAQNAGALTTLTSILLNITGCHMMRGEWDVALETAAEAELLAKQIEFPLAEVMARVWRACSLGCGKADYDAAEDLHRGALEQLPDDPGVAFAVDIINRFPMAALRDDYDEMSRLASTHRTQAEFMHYGYGWMLIDRARKGSIGVDDLRAMLGSTPPSARPVNMRFLEQTALAIALGRTDPEEATLVAETLLGDVPPEAAHGIIVKRYLAEAALDDGWGDPVPWLLDIRERSNRWGHARFVVAVDELLRRAGASVSADGESSVVEAELVDGDSIPEELRTAGVTQREWDVLCRLHAMPTNAELAEEMYLSVRTIEKHVSSLLAKLHAESRRDLARIAQRNGWIAL